MKSDLILCIGTTPAVQQIMIFAGLSLGSVNQAKEIHYAPAGKVVNVAKVAHALGERTLAITLTGGHTGQSIHRDLKQQGVPHELVEVSAPTRVCTTAIDRSAITTTECVEEPGAVSEAEYRLFRRKCDAAITHAAVLVLSGSLAPGVPQDFYADCVRLANARGIPVILDAQGQPLQYALPLHPLIIKPNRAELAATLGTTLDSDAALVAAIRQVIAAGPSWAAVTAGAGGVLVSNGSRTWRMVPPQVTVVNAIGSGDSFAAGLASALVHGSALPEAMRRAVACGTANALNLMPGQVFREDVDRLERQVAMEEINLN